MYFFSRRLRGLSPNFHIHVFVSDLYIGQHIFCSRIGMQIDPGNISLTDT